MTACARYPDDDTLLQYVSGELTDPERSAFEDHLFACDACLERVERYQAARQALAARPLPVEPPAVTPTGADVPPDTQRPAWMWFAMAAVFLAGLAAVFMLARPGAPPTQAADGETRRVAGAGDTSRPATGNAAAPTSGHASPSLQLAVLAMVTPPPYVPLVTRSTDTDETRFAEGMEAYARGDWGGVTRALGNAESPRARFYLGIARLMRGDAAGATAALDAVRQSESQPYARESVFYLGKAELQRGDVPRARDWFSRARDANAGPDGEARRLLAELDDIAVER